MTRPLTPIALLPFVFACAARAEQEATLALQNAAEQPVTLEAPALTHEVINDASTGTGRVFLSKGARYWSLGVGYADDWDGFEELQTSIAYHAFIEQRVEFIVELAVRNINQDGDNLVGFNPLVGFRWHFWRSDNDATWTAFADAGIGAMGSTSDVPEDGTSFNFTPRAGVGVTWQVLESARLVAGLRWSHISNGRLWGNDDNPGIDTPMLHVGFMFTF